MDTNKIYDEVMKAVDSKLKNTPRCKCDEHVYHSKSIDEIRRAFTAIGKTMDTRFDRLDKRMREINNSVIRLEEREKQAALFWGGLAGIGVSLISAFLKSFFQGK